LVLDAVSSPLTGKHGRVRSIPMPGWAKAAIDCWPAAWRTTTRRHPRWTCVAYAQIANLIAEACSETSLSQTLAVRV
jgi:hypothetical protein